INGALVFALGFTVMMFSFVVGHFCSKLFKLEGPTSNIFKMHFMFGNVIYLAFPLISSMYEKEPKALIYAMFYSLANDALLWTLGIYLVNRHNKHGWKENAKHLVNANTIAFASGLLIIFVKLGFGQYLEMVPAINTVSGFLYRTFHDLGKTTIYLSMLFIGLMLSEIKISGIKDLKNRVPTLILSLFKLVIIPAAVLLLLSFTGEILDPLVIAVIVLQIGMPCGTIVSALAAQYESDYLLATENVFFTTILGIITMPMLVLLITKI
ncbi:MAG: AEC family transporter, partial [Clostridiaceae bacterium]|nr:AEC family transporter [Clostridiaceae bacterium]